MERGNRGIEPEPVSPKPRAPRSGLSKPYRLLLMLAVLFVTVVFIFPIVLTPGVEPLNYMPRGSPLSMTVRISNQNPFTPLTDVEYSCEVSKLTLMTDAKVTDANVFIQGVRQEFDGRKAITAPCETTYIVDAPIKAAQYKLTLTYRPYPWPQHRTSMYRIDAEIDGNGHVTGWKVI